MEGLTRGQLAKRAQVNLETVRFYEQEGLLVPPSRTVSGYRKFEEVAVDRLAFVKRAKALGFLSERYENFSPSRTVTWTRAWKYGISYRRSWRSSATKRRSSKNWKLN